MSNVHVIMIEDYRGDLIDIEHYHHSCAPPEAKEWPAPESVDYPVFCVKCEKVILEIPLSSWYHSEQ